jgi:hypothetical protein
MKSIRNILVGAILLAGAARAQSLPDTLMMSGTVMRDATNRDWAYIMWQPTTRGLLDGKQFAVYVKPGAPATPGSFVRKAVVFKTGDPSLIASLLARAESIGDDVTALDQDLDALADTFGFSPALSTANKLAAAIEAAESKPSTAGLLALIGTAHPSVAMVYGRAWAGEIGAGPSTIELREWDAVNSVDLAVVGRVTVTANAPTLMPAPGQPIQVPDGTPQGDLVIRMRWATPTELRRELPRGTGFNVWRMTMAAAVSGGFDTNPPTPAQLAALSATGGVVRVNAAPLFPETLFDPTNVLDVVSNTTSYISDDNGRYETNGVAFADGAAYMYFVSARDVLGRDGTVSPGGSGLACHTVPPPPPRSLRVENDYAYNTNSASSNQTLRFFWKPDTNPAPDEVAQYQIFRGLDLALLDATNGLAASNLIATIASSFSTNDMDYSDTNLVPEASYYGTTFWYAVRSVRDGVCGSYTSSISPPVFGALKQVAAPPAPIPAAVPINCPRLLVGCASNFTGEAASPPPGQKYTRVEVVRRDHGVAWAEVRVAASGNSTNLFIDSGRVYFDDDEDTLAFDGIIPLTNDSPQARVTVGAGGGSTSVVNGVRFTCAEMSPEQVDSSDCLAAEWLLPAADSPTVLSASTSGWLRLSSGYFSNSMVLVEHTTNGIWEKVSLEQAQTNFVTAYDPLLTNIPQVAIAYRVWRFKDLYNDGPCAHNARPEGSDAIIPYRIRLALDERAEEYRIYRRVDDGPMTLIAQGAVVKSSEPIGQQFVERLDDNMPAAHAQVCYFGQFIDVNGNGSPLSPLGCTLIKGAKPPVPVLATPESTGTTTNPQVRLTWFCPTPGVDRFEIFIAPKTKSATPTPAPTNAMYTTIVPSVMNFLFKSSGLKVKTEIFQTLLTPTIGSGAIGAGPAFTFDVPVLANETYDITIRSVAIGNGLYADRSGPSGMQRFQWLAPTVVTNVPWPPRPLPPVVNFHPGIAAVAQAPVLGPLTNTLLWPGPKDAYPVGVRIGAYLVQLPDSTSEPPYCKIGAVPLSQSSAHLNPDTAIFRHISPPNARTNEALLPAVLYRQQVTNALFRTVSGDVIQVSPYIRSVAYFTQSNVDETTYYLADPFVGLIHANSIQENLSTYELWLMDTHPVQAGARYRYWLIHFKSDGEMDCVVPAGEVTIP